MTVGKFFENVINPSICILLSLGLIFIFGDRSWWPSYYQPFFYGAIFPISALSIIIPRLIFKTDSTYKKNAVILLQAAIALMMILNALGEIYFYQLYIYGIHYDKIIHFANSFILALVIPFFLETRYKLPRKDLFIISILLVLIAGVLWEFIEYFSDYFFKTSQFGIYGKHKALDTTFDLASNALGLFLGSRLLQNRNLSRKVFGEYMHRPFLKKAYKL